VKQNEREIAVLSARLQTDLQAFSGRRPAPPPRFRAQLLIPVAVIACAALVVALSPQARRSILLKLTLAASTHVLQRGVDIAAVDE
jgi:hypothetical protein